MFKKLSAFCALLYAVPALAQTSTTSTTPGVVDVTVPLQVVTPSGCAVAFSSAGTVPVIAAANCPASAPVSAPPPPPPPPPIPTPPPEPTPAPTSHPAAFPGAQGSAASSLCGRGNRKSAEVIGIEVTNQNDSGPGSLRACVMASGPRTCIFRVAGLDRGRANRARRSHSRGL